MTDLHERIHVIRHILSTLVKEDLDRQVIQAYITKNAHGIEAHLNAFREGLDFMSEEKRTDAIKRHVTKCGFWAKSLRDAASVLAGIAESCRTIERQPQSNIPGEVWVDIPGFEGRYKFSNKNRAFSKKWGEIMNLKGNGYGMWDGTKTRYMNLKTLRKLCGFEGSA